MPAGTSCVSISQPEQSMREKSATHARGKRILLPVQGPFGPRFRIALTLTFCRRIIKKSRPLKYLNAFLQYLRRRGKIYLGALQQRGAPHYHITASDFQKRRDGHCIFGFNPDLNLVCARSNKAIQNSSLLILNWQRNFHLLTSGEISDIR